MGKQQNSIETVLQQTMQGINLKLTSLMPNFLRIMEWNANGLLQHKDELQAILSTENIDICLISETNLQVNLILCFESLPISTWWKCCYN
jgi:hypothetical protein